MGFIKLCTWNFYLRWIWYKLPKRFKSHYSLTLSINHTLPHFFSPTFTCSFIQSLIQSLTQLILFLSMYRARLTTEECLEHRWLMLNSQMIKMRKSAIFPTERLRLFEEDYIRRRMSGGGPSSALMSVYGKQDVFSDSEDELFGGTDWEHCLY